MDISKFYELRERLYNTAAAGCMTISEDFRLKRAVEDFKPLAEANKAFAKLLSLCEALISSDKPESVIADCIALADALAVTQGIFADNSEVLPAQGGFPAAEKPASAVSAITELLEKSKDELWKLSAEYKDTLRDPRVVSAFLAELETGKFNENYQVFCEIMCSLCGKELVPALKASVKETGRQLKYIAKLSGDEENEFFRALATDESRPEKVRIEAVCALSCSPENGALLAEIYNTSKGKLKDAALMTLAEMDAPEAEPVFEKLLKKYKKSMAGAVAASSGKTCTEFVRKYLLELLDIAEHSEDSKARLEAGMDLESAATTLLQNKTELDDVFLKLSVQSDLPVNIDPKSSCISALMRTLTGKNAAAVRAQIDRLYAKAPEVFYRPKAFADFLERPEKEPVVSNEQYNRADYLGSLSYIPLLGSYFFAQNPYYNSSLLPLTPLCERLPEWIIQHICKTGDETERLFRQLDAPKRKDMLKNAEKLGFKGSAKEDALTIAYRRADNSINMISSVIRRSLLPNCSAEDYERIRAAGMYFVQKCMNTFGGHG
ncbi:MAG: HEAT repeat domain-containing protein, partial [Oscillospiraceae bacterium]